MADHCIYCMAEMNGGSVCPVCGNDIATYKTSIHHIKPGTILGGKYVIGCVLGEGGFGITYLGKDTTLDMKVAIKEYFPRTFAARAANSNEVMSTGGQEEVFERGRERFLREARTIAKMDKLQTIVNVRDFVTENNTAYFRHAVKNFFVSHLPHLLSLWYNSSKDIV